MTYYTYSATDLLLSVTEDKNIIELNTYDAENIRSSGRTLTSAGEGNVTSLETFVTLSGTLLSEIHTEKAGDTIFTGSLGTTATTRNLVYGNGLETIGDTYAITNSHGDVKKLVDTSGNVLYSYVYDAFGNLLSAVTGTATTGTATTGTGSASAFSSLTDVISGTLTFVNDILYASEQYDSVTGTYYLRARDYAPELGRFTCEDDYLGDGRNLYTYVSNNPLRFVDPSGYCKENKVSGWKWALDGLKIIGGAVLCATGVGTAVGVSLIVSGVGDVVVDVMTECGASGKETAIVSDGIQIVSGVAMLLNPVTAAAGAASIGSGVGGLAGGFAGEAIYEAVTGEQSDAAFAVGSSVGNIIGGIAGSQVYKGVEAVKATTDAAGKTAETAEDVAKAGINKGVGNPVEVAGKGNTGRTVPNSLNEQMAMHQVQSNPLEGAVDLSKIKKTTIMNDSRWLASDGWVKMSNNVDGTEIHFLYNVVTGEFDDFKFK